MCGSLSIGNHHPFISIHMIITEVGVLCEEIIGTAKVGAVHMHALVGVGQVGEADVFINFWMTRWHPCQS